MHNSDNSPESRSAKSAHLRGPIAGDLRDEKWLAEAYSIIERKTEIQAVVTELRDFLKIDHLVYYTSKFGGSPSTNPYIRLTFPASWLARYLGMGYADVDPILREGFRRIALRMART